jgi:hypothetical protein
MLESYVICLLDFALFSGVGIGLKQMFLEGFLEGFLGCSVQYFRYFLAVKSGLFHTKFNASNNLFLIPQSSPHPIFQFCHQPLKKEQIKINPITN